MILLFFFFKQKTAYEMLRSLVGSEMCIRDRYEMETLKAESATHKSRVAQAATALRAKEARKKVLKSEVDAVKSGKKAKPFIPSRSAFKAKVEEARYDHLVEKGGEQQAAKFIEKKRKKKQRME
eukprot:TRINITY_DN22086_c0_g1_i1.p1 TRINITY_DN22086_c0_g1~~TRINITY_DN22086_c0_g1_i1.p1  ORF type:complete len:124 (+),score=65.27 TRINITY_DN22086_c0_g1_i1:34-405(+)